jgi:hypothetical protein
MVGGELFERMGAIIVSLVSGTVMLGLTVVFTGATPLFARYAVGLCRPRSSTERHRVG